MRTGTNWVTAAATSIDEETMAGVTELAEQSGLTRSQYFKTLIEEAVRDGAVFTVTKTVAITRKTP